ncbi:MAG: hypothetical protein WCO36_00030 [Actinomycetes bacterium]
MPSRSSASRVTPYADALLARDLPALDPQRRGEAVQFVAIRVADLPAPMKLAVGILAVIFDLGLSLGSRRTYISVSSRLPIPFVSEYPRLIRSLAFAYVWEKWPDTRPDGGRAQVEA